jgi:hypothetical protein
MKHRQPEKRDLVFQAAFVCGDCVFMPDFCEWGLGEHGRVFDQPDFVFGVGRARGVEGFHGLKGGGVVGSA